ncbi:MAG: hypothetical protein AAF629_27435 [Chloroflexota bacterium]
MPLTTQQKRTFCKAGFVRIPSVVPPIMVDNALRAINHSFGTGLDPKKMQTFRSRSFTPELQKEAVITDLLNKTPALLLAESLVGP